MDSEERRQDLAERLIAARKAAGLSQYELERLSGVSRSTIGTIEKAKPTSSPTLKTLEKLAEACNVPLSELTGVEAGVEDRVQPLVDQFLESPEGLAAKPTEDDIRWLRSLSSIGWAGGRPTHKTILYMLLGLREADRDR